MDEDIEDINLVTFIEAYEDLTMMQLWDFLVYNGFIKAEKYNV